MNIDINVSLSLSSDLKKFIESLAAAYQHNIGHKLQNIMSAISDFAAKQDAHNQVISDGLDGIATDLQGLKDLITTLQNTPGPISVEDQATLDDLETKATALANRVKALDETTPPAVPVA